MIPAEWLPLLQPMTHYALHVLFPGLIAWLFFREHWKKAWLIMLATLFVDLDHLAATPVFDPSRCSIGFHVLHSYLAIAVYSVMAFLPHMRILAIGLLFHMATDYLDCLWMSCP